MYTHRFIYVYTIILKIGLEIQKDLRFQPCLLPGWHLKSVGEPPLACLPSSSRGHDECRVVWSRWFGNVAL